VCERFNWVCHAYCLMTNHYHLVVETPKATLHRACVSSTGYTRNTSIARTGAWDMSFKAAIGPSWWKKTVICWSWRATWSSIRCAPAWSTIPRNGRGAATAP
jgi:REP element-mobilizing transposase RayT